MADPGVAGAVHGAVQRRFDGETNVLFTDLLRSTAPQERRAVATMRASMRARTNRSLDARVGDARGAYGAQPHVYWHQAAAWDGETTPLVGYSPDGQDTDVIEAFDAEGNSYRVDEATAERRPVIVVNRNERTTEEGDLLVRARPVEPGGQGGGPSDVTTYVEPIECGPEVIDCGGGGGGGGTNPDDSYPGYLKIARYSFDEPAEGWPNGGPEFYANFFTTSSATETNRPFGRLGILGLSREQCDGRTLYLAQPYIAPWRTDLGYLTMYIKWVEQDDRDFDFKFQTSAPFKIASMPFSVNADIEFDLDGDDDLLSEALVNHDDGAPNEYNWGMPSAKIYRTAN